MSRPKRARLYVLYEDWKGNPRSQWRYKSGRPRVPGCRRPNRYLHPPPFRWVVRAGSAKGAYGYVRLGRQAAAPGKLGIVFDRNGPKGRAKELLPGGGRYWSVESRCAGRQPILMLFESFPRAQRLLRALGDDCVGPHGRCCGQHRVALRTKAEARRLVKRRRVRLSRGLSSRPVAQLRAMWHREVAAVAPKGLAK